MNFSNINDNETMDTEELIKAIRRLSQEIENRYEQAEKEPHLPEYLKQINALRGDLETTVYEIANELDIDLY